MLHHFPSRSGKIKSFCFLLSLLVFSGLAQSDRFPQLEYNESGKTIYLDSLGRPIGNLAFDGGEHFKDGIATVYRSSEKGNQAGVINSKGKLIVPFGFNYIQNVGKGFTIVAFETTRQIYNQNGHMIYTCQKCYISDFTDINLFGVHPNPFMYKNGEKVLDTVMVINDKGKEVFRTYGNSVERLVDVNLMGEKSNLPYLKISNSAIYSLNGKLIMDSLHGIYFTAGYAGVYRCGKQALLDTDLKQVIPFSAGYSALYKLNEHPVAGAVSAGKNGKYGIITLDQKIIVPFKYRYFLRFDGQAQLYSMSNEKGDSTWTFTLEGDTIFSPEYYIVDGLDPKKGNFIKHPLSQKTGFKIEGKVVIPPTYNFLIPLSKDSLLFMKDGAAGYISPSGKTLFTFPFACFGVS